MLVQLWTIPFLAHSKLGMTSDRAIRRWRSGQNRILSALADWLLQLIARTVENLPPPKDWE
ncbi:MAG TPA: hypothetical protein VKI44_03790 [Acetobacteraceae bacterium]|nr:hypothetical protein [Acetobacteraceae bacterium]